MPIPIGRYRERVTLENPSAPSASISDGEGGYTQTWSALSPSPVWASVLPANATNMERHFAGTIEARLTHIVRIRYHSQVTTKTRLTYDARYLYVRGFMNPEELDEETVMACEEVLT